MGQRGSDPVFLLVSVVVALLLYEWFGYKPEHSDAPQRVDLVGAVAAIAIFLVPCVTAMRDGWQAIRGGDRRGLTPLGIGALAGLSLKVLRVVGTLGPS